MEISQRKKKILAAVVDEYIRTAEPVGSKTIAQIAGLGCSSATIRNELSELTALGYLEQPHTSAGRIPSPQGYRFYVNELMERQRVSVEEAEAINARLSEKMEQLDKLMSDAGKLAGQLTGYPALTLSAPRAATIRRFDLLYIDANTFIIVVLLGDNTVKNKLVHLPFSVEQGQIQKLSALFNAGFTNIPEESVTPVLISATERAARDTMGLTSIIAAYVIEVLSESRAGAAFVTGESSLLQQPEFRDPDKAHRVISYLSDSDHLMRLPGAADSNPVRVIIGPENVAEELRDSSVVMASYDAGEGQRGLIGVVGPLRMDYSAVAAKLKYIADGLSRLLGAGEAPAGFGKMIKETHGPMSSKNKETAPKEEQPIEETPVEEAPEAMVEEVSETDALRAELESAQNDLAAEKDKNLRLRAEYDNFRKRSARERDNIYADVKADTLKKLLPIFDNLERALRQETADEAYKKGVKMTMTQFLEALQALGVTPIEAVGQKFDPNEHNAVMHMEDPEKGEGEIVQEFQKGFKMGDRVIRFSMVQVAN